MHMAIIGNWQNGRVATSRCVSDDFPMGCQRFVLISGGRPVEIHGKLMELVGFSGVEMDIRYVKEKSLGGDVVTKADKKGKDKAAVVATRARHCGPL